MNNMGNLSIKNKIFIDIKIKEIMDIVADK
jgi:hypothetical protein